MFNNIGGKIKALASVIAWLGIGFSVIIGIVLMATAEELIFIGLIVAIVGSISSWIGSFLIYGFGELAENSAIMAQKANMSLSEIKDSGIKTGERIVNQSAKSKVESHLIKVQNMILLIISRFSTSSFLYKRDNYSRTPKRSGVNNLLL